MSENITYIPGLVLTEDQVACAKQELFDVVSEDRNSLKYNLFDVGALLLRGDTEGYRKRAWRQELHNEINQHNKDINLFGKDKRVTAQELSQFIELEFRDYDYWLLDLGIAALEADQHVTYRRRFNNIMYYAQRLYANRLKRHGIHIVWANSCGAPEEGARYIFSSCIEE